MNGIINIYKEKGFTSHDVVAKLRGICHQKKIGHTGTLDPDAEGVLPVCLGNATSLCDLLTCDGKEYEAVLLLGITTDTQDISGTILEQKDVNLSEADVLLCIKDFIGDIEQIPPMYSALKVNGRKLYELAREGKSVERKPRRITIDSIEIKDVDMPRITMRISCSKGTYIRTLCNDIGVRLGCGGTMESLVRTQSGEYRIEDAVRLGCVQEWADRGELEKHILTVEEYFADCESIRMNVRGDKLLHNGNTFTDESVDGPVTHMKRYRVYDSTGVFYGVYEYDKKRKIYKPFKMFIP